MFRKIHGSVGDLDKLLRRRAMEWIARDAEAGADVFLAQQWIGGDPAAQLARQLPRMLHIGLRHGNDEFVPSVASHNVGGPAIGLPNLPDGLGTGGAPEGPGGYVY